MQTPSHLISSHICGIVVWKINVVTKRCKKQWGLKGDLTPILAEFVSHRKSHLYIILYIFCQVCFLCYMSFAFAFWAILLEIPFKLYLGMPPVKGKEGRFISVSWCTYWGKSLMAIIWLYAGHCIYLMWYCALASFYFWKILHDSPLQVDPFTSVSAAHSVGEHVRSQIHKSHPEVSEVFIHIGMHYSFSCIHIFAYRNYFEI